MAYTHTNRFPLLPSPARLLLTSPATIARQQHRRTNALTISRAPIGTPLPSNRTEAQPKIRILSRPPAESEEQGDQSTTSFDSANSDDVQLKLPVDTLAERRDSAIAKEMPTIAETLAAQTEMSNSWLFDAERRSNVFDYALKSMNRPGKLPPPLIGTTHRLGLKTAHTPTRQSRTAGQ